MRTLPLNCSLTVGTPHLAVGLSLLLDPDCNVLDQLSDKARQEFRFLCVSMILGTDLAVHFEQLAQFQVKIEAGFQLQGENNDLNIFLANLLHAADLGSTARPPPLYYNWMQRVFGEFFRQGAEQKVRGLEVTPFMDREKASITKAQQGFIKYICQPVFQAMVRVAARDRSADASVARDRVLLALALLAPLHPLSTLPHMTPLHTPPATLPAAPQVGCIPAVETPVQNCLKNIEMLKTIEEAGFSTDEIMAKALRELMPAAWGSTPEMPTPSLEGGVRGSAQLFEA